jgi:hypothetical protein
MINVFKLIEDNGLNLHGDIEHFAVLVADHERQWVGLTYEEIHELLDDASGYELLIQVEAKLKEKNER